MDNNLVLSTVLGLVSLISLVLVIVSGILVIVNGIKKQKEKQNKRLKVLGISFGVLILTKVLVSVVLP